MIVAISFFGASIARSHIIVGIGLRSSTSNELVVARTRGKAGDAAFAVAAPRLWNALPHALKSVASINIFKTNLKTHLFIC